MAFNPNKCEVLRVTNKRRFIPVSYAIHGQQLQRTLKAKYLGSHHRQQTMLEFSCGLYYEEWPTTQQRYLEKIYLHARRKVSKGAKIRNRYNQVPNLTQGTNGKVTNPQLDTTNESQEVSPFPAGDHKAQINRPAQGHNKHKTETTQKIHKRSTALERSVKCFTGGLKPVSRR